MPKTVKPVPGPTPRTQSPVFSHAMKIRSEERDKEYNSKSYQDDPRFFASGLGKCYRQQSYWMRGVEPDAPYDPITRLTFETGNMWESWMGDWYLEWMVKNDPRVDRIETQVVFRFTTRQGVVISGKADFIIWWNEHPETGQPEVEIGDFKTDSDYGFNLRRTGKDTFQTAHMLQVMVGAVALKTREENPIEVTRWRLVYIAKGLPFRKTIFAWDNKGNDPMDFAAVEFAESTDDGRWLDDLRTELKALAHLQEMVANGDEVARQIPFANMAYAIDAFDSETGKGVFTHEDGSRRQWWGCSGGSRTLTSYCNYRNRCEAELNGETYVALSERVLDDQEAERQALAGVGQGVTDEAIQAAHSDPERDADREEDMSAWQSMANALPATFTDDEMVAAREMAAGDAWDDAMVTAEEDERQRRIRELAGELRGLRAEEEGDVEQGQRIIREAAGLDITPEDLADQMAMERDAEESTPAPEQEPPIRLEDCTSIGQVSAWTLHDAWERLESETIEDKLKAIGARWDAVKKGQSLTDLVKVDRGGEVTEVPRIQMSLKALHWLEARPSTHPSRDLTFEEATRRQAIKNAAMTTIEKERTEMRAQQVADSCLWCGEHWPDSDYCSAEHALAAMADKAGRSVCAGFAEDGGECLRPIPQDQTHCGGCLGKDPVIR